MTLFKCDDICPVARRHILKRVQYPPNMSPATYANTGPTPFASHYLSYPLENAFNVNPQKTASLPGPLCTNKYAEEGAGIDLSGGAGPPLTSFTGAQQRMQAPVSKYGYSTSSLPPPEDIVYAGVPHSTGGGLGKLPEPHSLLTVPEPGTQYRGSNRERFQPRATTSPAGIAFRENAGTHQHDLQQEVKRLQTMLNARENQLDLKEAELQDALSKLQDQRKQGSQEELSENEESVPSTLVLRAQVHQH